MRIASLSSLLLIAALGGCSLLPDGGERSGSRDVRGQAPARQAETAQIATTRESRQCLSELAGLQADFTPLPDRDYGTGCSTNNTVALSQLRSDDDRLALSNLGPVSCPLATTFAGWARYGVDRAARQQLGSPLKKIETFGSYSCRNVAGSGRRSAHASAQAIDVAAFVLEDGRRISVKDGWQGTRAEKEFLQTIQNSACKRFGTVLGPEYNRAHEDHFHLEEGGGGFCR